MVAVLEIMASRLRQLIEEKETEIRDIGELDVGSRLKFLSETGSSLVSKIPEIPKPVQAFPSTMESLAELQIDPLSLKENPLEAFGAAWDSLKTTVTESASKIISQFTGHRTAGEQLSGVAAVGHLVFSPITAFFEGANKIPVLGSVSKLISLPFIAVGEGATKVSDKIVDELPIPKEQKPDIKEGLGEIFSLASQIALGKVTHIAEKKVQELRTRFGEKDAQTIINKSQGLAEQAREPVPKEIIEAEPLRVKDIPPETKMGDIAKVARERGFDVPEFGVEEVIPKKRGKFIDVPREQLPVKMESAEMGVSALEARMKGIFETENVKTAIAVAEARGLDISIYDKMSKPEQLRLAAKYVQSTSQRNVLEVLEGKREAPKGLLHNAIMLALEEKSLRDRNIDLGIRLASLRSTRMGQEISILTEATNSFVSGLDQIIRARREATTSKLKQGETIQTKKSSAVKEIKTEQTKTQLKMSEVEKILKNITC